MKYLVRGPYGVIRRELQGKSTTIISRLGLETLVESDEQLTFEHPNITVTEYVEPPKVITEAERIEALEALLISKNVVSRGEVNSAVTAKLEGRGK